MKTINYETLIRNLVDMINILEYDSMRSSGKAKMNAQQLESMYNLVDRYKKLTNSQPKAAKKEG